MTKLEEIVDRHADEVVESSLQPTLEAIVVADMNADVECIRAIKDLVLEVIDSTPIQGTPHSQMSVFIGALHQRVEEL